MPIYIYVGRRRLFSFDRWKILKEIDEFSECNSTMENTHLVVEEVHGMLERIYRPRMNSYKDTRGTCHELQLEIDKKKKK